MLALQSSLLIHPRQAHHRNTPVGCCRGATPHVPSSSNRPQSPTSPAWSAFMGAVGSAVLLASGEAQAYNVHLRDMGDNPVMQSGVQAATEGRWSDAERLFQVVLKQDSGSASAYSNLGNVRLSTGRPQLALEDFSRAIALAPEAPVPYLNRAIAEEQLGVEAEGRGEPDAAASFYRRAVEDCEEAQSLDPKEFAAYFNEGNVQMRLGQFHGALASYTRAADLAPGISGYRLREATLLFQTEQNAEADRLLKSVLRRNPNYAGVS